MVLFCCATNFVPCDFFKKFNDYLKHSECFICSDEYLKRFRRGFLLYIFWWQLKTKTLSGCVHSVSIFYEDGWQEIVWRWKTKLISLYRNNPELWDSTNPYYKNKDKREEFRWYAPYTSRLLNHKRTQHDLSTVDSIASFSSSSSRSSASMISSFILFWTLTCLIFFYSQQEILWMSIFLN